jgi:hypothetical protein
VLGGCAVHRQRIGVLLALSSSIGLSAQLNYGPVPHPVVGPDAWVLIEVWPTVKDITLSAYFLSDTSKKNQNLCEATKRALDRDAAALAKEQKREATSFRECLTVRDAVRMGYVSAP